MKMGRKLMFGLFAIVIAASFVLISGPAMAAEEKKDEPTQFVGILAYRTGPFAAGGSGFSSGMEDYMELINMNGGINGSEIVPSSRTGTGYPMAGGKFPSSGKCTGGGSSRLPRIPSM